MIFDLFDKMIADELGVPVKDYIKKIESFDEKTMETIILNVIEGDGKLAKELYNKEN